MQIGNDEAPLLFGALVFAAFLALSGYIERVERRSIARNQKNVQRRSLPFVERFSPS